MRISKTIKRLMEYNLWDTISGMILDESFIEKYKDKVNWSYISQNQILSEAFIENHKELVYWPDIFRTQVLSEEFIEKHKDQYDGWAYAVSVYQHLSESFIEKHKKDLDLGTIAYWQPLSSKFCKKHLKTRYLETQAKNHAKKSLSKKKKEMVEYAELWNLKFDGKFLYAFRNHVNGRGFYNKARIYKKGKTYRDWHCDMNTRNLNSFGLGIWPEGNTPVKVAVEDWGCAVTHEVKFKKGRVFAFTVLP